MQIYGNAFYLEGVVYNHRGIRPIMNCMIDNADGVRISM